MFPSEKPIGFSGGNKAKSQSLPKQVNVSENGGGTVKLWVSIGLNPFQSRSMFPSWFSAGGPGSTQHRLNPFQSRSMFPRPPSGATMMWTGRSLNPFQSRSMFPRPEVGLKRSFKKKSQSLPKQVNVSEFQRLHEQQYAVPSQSLPKQVNVSDM